MYLWYSIFKILNKRYKETKIMNAVKLVEYVNEQNQSVELIKQFWLCHNHIIQTQNECLQDVENWIKSNHQVYFIVYQK